MLRRFASAVALVLAAWSAIPWQQALASGTCTAPSASYPSIQSALNDAACTTVKVAAGTYTVHLTMSRPVTLEGAGPAKTILDGTGNGRVVHVTNAAGGTFAVSDMTVRNGHVNPASQPAHGAGIDIEGTTSALPTLNIDNVVFSHDIAQSSTYGAEGGAIYGLWIHLTIDHSAFRGNQANGTNGAVGLGGAIYLAGTAVITTTTFDSNSTSYGGGVLSAGDGSGVVGHVTLNRDTFSGNTATDTNSFAAALSIGTHGTSNIKNSTFSGNSAARYNVLYTVQNSPVHLTNTTIGGNARPASFSSDIGVFGPMQFQDTIVAGPDGAQGKDCAIASTGSITSLGNNIDRDGTCGFDQPTDQVADPLLTPIGNYGGPTRTMGIGPSSPAFDHGANCLSIDQRGVPRPQGNACDVGSYERALCRGAVVNVVGTAGNDTIAAKSFVESVLALGGNDTVSLGSKGGWVCGGPDDDHLVGGSGDDVLDGGTGTDYCDGGAGTDQAYNCETVVNVP